jgi:RHS repeat-associated protein
MNREQSSVYRALSSVMQITIYVLICLASSSSLLRSQEANSIGFPSNGIFHGSGIDTVNVQNGNLHIEIPLWSAKGRNGLSLGYKFVYDNFGYYKWQHCDRFDVCVSEIRGETYNNLSLKVVSPFGISSVTGNDVYQICSAQTYLTHTNRFIHEPDGTSHHVLPDPYNIGGPGTPTCFPSTAVPAYADDGSGWTATASGSINDKAGNSLTTTACPDGFLNMTVKDSNGNQLYAPCDFANVTDTLNRSTPYTGLSYYDSSGTSQTIQVQTTAITVNTNLCSGDPSCSEVSGTSNVPSQITLPNGMTYVFEYSSCKSGGIDFGEPCSVTLPTGGKISWTWGAIGLSREGRKVASRTETANGQTFTWTYNSLGVTDPAGNLVQYSSTLLMPGFRDWYYTTSTPYPTKAQYYQGGVLVKTVDTVYNTTGTILPIRETTTWNQQNLTTKTETDYDGISVWSGTLSFKNPIEKREYAFAASPNPGGLVRKTHYNYKHLSTPSYLTANILDKPISKIVYDSTGTNIVAQMTYTYDGVTTTSTSGSPAPNHDYTNFGTSNNVRGNLTQIGQGLKVGATWTWLNTNKTFNDLGDILTSQDPGGHSTTFDYTDSWATISNPQCAAAHTYAFPTTITDALTHHIKQTYFSCTGLTASTKDDNDISAGRNGTSFTYDLMNRSLVTSFPDGGQVAKSYDDTGTLAITTSQLVTTGLTIVKTAQLDGLGRILQTQMNDPDCGSGTGAVKVDYTYGYDSVNHLRTESVTTPYCNSIGGSFGQPTTKNYDVLGRVTSVVETDGSTVNMIYGGTTAGLLSTTADEAGKQRTSQTDALGRLTAVWEDPASLNYLTTYSYDTLDNLTGVSQTGNAASSSWRNRSFTYDSLSRLKCAANPEVTSGLSTASPASCPATDTGTYTSGTIGYAYDNDGNLLTKTSPAPNQTGTATVTTNYSYDNVHRLKQKSYTGSPATATVQYGYDGTALSGCTTAPPALSPVDANAIGNRSAMCDASGASSYSHDEMGRVLKRQQIIQGTSVVNKATTYTYYEDGETNTIKYPVSSRVLTYTANSASGFSAARPVSVTDTTNNYVTGATYWPQGSLSAMLLGGVINGAFTLNKRMQPYHIFYGTNAPPPFSSMMSTGCSATVGNIMHRAYDFHLAADNGNIYTIRNCRDTTRTQVFTYDNLNRISQANSSGPSWGETFTIDAWGNLTNKAGVTGKTNTEPFNAAPASIKNQLNAFCHDSAGNLVLNATCPTGSFTPTYSYDIEDRLTGTAGYTYVYDGDGNRVKKCSNVGCTSGTLYWTGTGTDPLDETGVGGTLTEEYVFFGGKRVARRDNPSNAVHYYFSDHLGSTDLITDATGATIQEESDYYPYGGEIAITNGDPNTYKFTGKERDGESSLDNFGARYYSSASARFVTPDWAAKATTVPYANFGNPQSLNLFSYVQNNPTTTADPDGHCGDPFSCGVEFAGIGTLIEPGGGTAVGAVFGTAVGTAILYFGGKAAIEHFQQSADSGQSSPAPATNEKVQPYDVGEAKDLQGRSAPGDEIDVHHVPQQKPASQTVSGYDSKTAPAIAVPKVEHKTIPTEKGEATRSPRDQLAKDAKDLRNKTNAPNSQVKKVIDLNKQKYPEMKKKPNP